MAAADRAHTLSNLVVVFWGLATACWTIDAHGSDLAPIQVDQARQEARAALAQVEGLLAAGDWSAAVEAVQRAVSSDPDRLLAATSASGGGDFERFVSVRRFGQHELVRIGRRYPAALTSYRRQADPAAQARLTRAVNERDEPLLRRIVAEQFASSAADKALLHLGEIALHRGDYTEARDAWERIAPALRAPPAAGDMLAAPADAPYWLALAGSDLNEVWPQLAPLLETEELPPARLVYPDSHIPLVDVRARLALASILQGDLPRAELELELLKRLHGDAEGRLAGQFGPYVEILETLLQQRQQWPSPEGNSAWPTFAGAATRDGRAASEIDIAGLPLWSVKLPRRTAQGELLGEQRLRPAEDRDGLLSYHPVVQDGMVIVQTGDNSIVAHDLRDGQTVWAVGDAAASTTGVVSQRFSGVPRFTLTADGRAVFARTGSPITAARRGSEPPVDEQGTISAFELHAEGKLLLVPIAPDDSQWAFDGAPLVDDGRIYVAMRRRDDVRVQFHAACFDMQSGRRIWRRLIAAAESPGEGQWDERTHNLLTLSEGVLYCNTNLGAVAALSAADGAVRWLVKYPRVAWNNDETPPPARHFLRDLNPCLAHRGLIIAAPRDCEQIFALDAASGQLVWATPAGFAADAVHLLGVGGGHLWASGDYLTWIDVHSGRLVGQFPAPRRDAPGFAAASPRGYGRGLLSARRVYWPTKEAIYVFEQRVESGPQGAQIAPRGTIELSHRRATGGNLVLADGVLLIASADRLTALAAATPDGAAFGGP